MIPFFKNSAFRIWCACLLAFTVCLGLIVVTGAVASLTMTLMIFGSLFATVYILIGWLSDQIVRIQLAPLLKEAEILERGGMGLDAERTFEKALALLDSFLVSPRRRRRYLRGLGARMARFYAAQAETSDRAARWISRYLNANPGDHAVAEIWLQMMESLTGWSRSRQDLMARIGHAHRDDWQFQKTLARIYIHSARTDFTALQTYRRIIDEPDRDPESVPIALANLFLSGGRADELALKVYVRAARQQDPSDELRSGMAACLRWIQSSARTHALLAQARQIMGPVTQSELERRSSGFLPPTGRSAPSTDFQQPKAKLRSKLQRAAQKTSHLGDRLHQQMHQAANGLNTKRMRAVFKIGLICCLAFAAVTLLWDTAGHLVKPPPPPPAPSPDATVKVEPAPYTLQVAAYRQPSYAERYIQALKAKGLDAYRAEARSQHNIWYQVRIGHFPTKAAARTYGQQLKTDGIIEDYYVANYEGP